MAESANGDLEGQILERDKGTPQGGVVSPFLANLFLHYAFDLWVVRIYPAFGMPDTLMMRCFTARAELEAE